LKLTEQEKKIANEVLKESTGGSGLVEVGWTTCAGPRSGSLSAARCSGPAGTQIGSARGVLYVLTSPPSAASPDNER